MFKVFVLCLSSLVLFCGCLASKVDGNRVNYPNGMSFEISNVYEPIGKAPYIKNIESYDDERTGTASSVIHLFAKAGTPFRDKTEFVGIYDFQLPGKWYMRHPGMAPNRHFWLNLRSYPAVANLLKEKGVLAASRFLCGEFYLYTYTSGQRSISYCAAESVVPQGADYKMFLSEKFSESVRIVAAGDEQTVQSEQSRTPEASVGSPSVGSVNSKGNHVVVAYSKIGKATFSGRSYKSEDDALNNAVNGCSYSDCRKLWVSNVNGCVAFAKHLSGAWGKARGSGIDEATASALKLCNAHTKDDGCEIVATLCPEY